MSNTDEIVQKIVDAIRTSVDPKQSLSNLKRNQDLVPAIVAIIKGAVNQSTATQVVTHAPTNDVVNAITRAVRNSVKLAPPVAGAVVAPVIAKAPSSISVPVIQQAPANAVVNAITRAVRNSVKLAPPVAGAVVAPVIVKAPSNVAIPVIQQAPANAVARAITRAIQNGVTLSPEVVQAAEAKKPGLFQRLMGFFAPKSKMPVYGPETQPNFIEAKVTGKNNQGRNTYNQTPPMPGYVLTTRNGKLGWYRNKPPVVPVAPATTTGPAPPPTQSRNYSKMTIRELLKAMRDYPANRAIISDALRKAFEKELRDLRYEYSRSRRVRKLGDLLRLLPRNYDGRRNASSMVVDDVRETRNSRELANVRSNLGSVPNENIRRAIETQRRRFENKKRREEEERRRTRYGDNYGRRPSVTRRANENNDQYELRRRRAALANVSRERVYGGEGVRRRFAPPPSGNEGVRRPFMSNGNGGEGVSRPFNQAPPPSQPLPINQQQAINNAGGVNKAMNTIVNIPGGASEVAKAAEALNETGGNTVKAIQIKGASPEAVKAVQNLGGPKNAVVVLEGLNTLSRKTPKKKGGKRRKTYRPRIAELNRVLESVKKQRLVSLVAHNVTKTHNIHPNDEKLKKYYKKVIKANILRTPFVKIVKKAAKRTA